MSIASCRKEKAVILSKHENGQIHEIISYKQPITEDSIGIKTLFFENGRLHCKGGYKMGKRHGKWKCIDRKGEIEWKGNYINGIENGEFYCKNENGTWKKFTTENGIRIDKTVEYNFDSTHNNFYYVYGQYENDLETGLWAWKDTNKQLMKEITYDEGVNIGYFAFYHPNGNLKMKGHGFRKKDEEFIRMKDTLFHYNEIKSGKIDSLEIFYDGKLQRTIRNKN